MENFLSWGGAIAILANIVFIIMGNVIRFIMWIRCFKVKECNNRRCINKLMCSKYSEQLTEDEYNELQKMIKDYKKQKLIKE